MSELITQSQENTSQDNTPSEEEGLPSDVVLDPEKPHIVERAVSKGVTHAWNKQLDGPAFSIPAEPEPQSELEPPIEAAAEVEAEAEAETEATGNPDAPGDT